MPAGNGTPDFQTVQQMMEAFVSARRTPSGIHIPKSAVPVFSSGFANAPAYGAGNQIVLTQYQVKANWYAIICGIVLQFSFATGDGPAPNPGDVQFTVDVDRPLGSTTAGYTEKDYAAVQMLLGSFTPGDPWPCEFRHQDAEILRIKVFTIANMGTGAGNILSAGLLGYEWPKEGWEG